jgi:hypothetical protein
VIYIYLDNLGHRVNGWFGRGTAPQPHPAE